MGYGPAGDRACGSVYLKADSGASTLRLFERRRHIKAGAGGKGGQ